MDIKKAIRFAYLLLLTLTPIIFTQSNSELFEVPKMYFVYLITAIILGLHLYNYFSGNTPLFKSNKILPFLLLFLLSQAVSTYFSVDPHTSFFGYYSRLNGGLFSLISFSLLFAIFPLYIDAAFLSVVINAILISGFFVAFYGFLEHFGIDQHVWVQDVRARVFSTLGQPNWLAAYLCILLPFALYKALESKRLFLVIGHWSLVILFFVTLLFTKSKTGLIAATLSLAIFFVIFLINNLRNKASILILVSSFAFLVSLSLIINNPIKDFVFPPRLEIGHLDLEISQPLNITPSEDIRKIVWTGALDLWRQFPYFGTGPETFAYTYYWTRPVAHNLTSEWDFLYNKAHNEYLNYLATTGSFGFITYILLLVSILYFLITTLIRHRSEPFNFTLYLAIITAFISILANNLTGFSVVVTSIYLLLLPAFSLSLNPDPPPFTSLPARKLTRFIAAALCLVLIAKISSFYIADIIYAKAQRSEAANLLDRARDQINSALFFNSDEPIYRSLLAQILAKKALVAHQSQSPDTNYYIKEAIVQTQKATAASPANLNFLKEQAQVYYYLATIDIKYYPNAIEALLKASRLAPTDPKTLYTLGKFWEAVNRPEDALTNYEQAISLKPNYDYAYFSAAKIYFDQKDYPKAKDYFEHVLSIAPTNTDAKDYLQKIIELQAHL